MSDLSLNELAIDFAKRTGFQHNAGEGARLAYVPDIANAMLAFHQAAILHHVEQPEKLVERIAHAICPHVKPWMDDESIAPHTCEGCKPILDDDGERLHPMCLAECKDIARSAIAAMGECNMQKMHNASTSNPSGYPAENRTATLKSGVNTTHSNGESMACEKSGRATVRSGEIPLHIEVPIALRISDILATKPHHKQFDAIMETLRPYLRTSEPEKCPDCGATMIEVCSGLEINARGEAAGLCCHSDYCEKPIKPVSVSLKTTEYNFSESFGRVSEIMSNEQIIQEIFDAAGVTYAE